MNPMHHAPAQGPVRQDRLYVGGEWLDPADGRLVDGINPLTEESIGRAALAGRADIDRAVRAARAAFDAGPWAASTVHERAAIMVRAGELIAARAEEFTRTITLEVGSPLPIATIQPPISKVFLDWHAAQASTFPWEEERKGVQGPLLVRRQPVGVVDAIVPWNFPLALSFPKLAPALLIGCSVVLKPPEETPLFGFLLAEVFAEAGLPAGVLNVVAADREVSEALVEHPLVDKISFTGSTRAGRRIASLCGAQIKRCSLELGGKSAAIVLPDADLDAVVPALAPSTMTNNGQTCMNQTRVLAYRERYADVVDALRETIAAVPVGDPADPDVFIGPLVSDVQRRWVEGYIAKGREAATARARVRPARGATRARRRPPRPRPRVLRAADDLRRRRQQDDDRPGGDLRPRRGGDPYDDENHAVAIANDSDYGLSGSVWGPDVEHAKDVARRIRSGNVEINQHTLDLGGPFGGFKRSGIGREYGLEGIEEYVEIQSIPYLRKPVRR
jgi:aldehyde dehydrogenase (NAD+)